MDNDAREPTDEVVRKLNRLASAFGVNPSQLRAQYFTFANRARERYNARISEGLNDADFLPAWRDTLKDTPANDKTALNIICSRYGAFIGCTTSGVEQIHSVQTWLWPRQRGSLGTARENDELRLINDQQFLDDENILKDSREASLFQ